MKKNLIPILMAFVLGFAVTTLESCKPGGDDDPVPGDDEKAKVTAILTSGTWKMSNTKVDGIDKTDVYKDLAVTFSATGFTAANGGPIWPATGTMTVATDGKSITLNDGLKVDITSISDSALTLALIWTKTTLEAGGRSASVSGNHVFTFTK